MIGMLYCKDLGEIVGDIEVGVDNRTYTVNYPHRIQMTERGPVIMNLLSMTTETSIELDSSALIFNKVYKLDPKLEEEVKSTIMPKSGLVLPENKLHLD